MGKKSRNHFGRWLIEFCKEHDLKEEDVINKFGKDSSRTIRLWFKGLGHPKSTSYIMLIITLSRLSDLDEESIYLQSSRAILRDA